MMRIAILGSGVSGLAAAAALQQSGIDYVLFDRDANPLDGGAALILWPNALFALNQLTSENISEIAQHPLKTGVLLEETSTLLLQLPLHWMKEEFSHYPICVRRSHLLHWLWDILDRPKIEQDTAIHTEMGRNQKIYVEFGSGRKDCFDGIIAADGIHSNIRKSIYGHLQRPTRYHAWRAIIQNAYDIQWDMAEYWGSGRRFGYARIDADHLYWFATLNYRWMQKDDQSFPSIRHQFSNLPDSIQKWIDHTPNHEIFSHSIYDIAPGYPLSSGPLLFMGDAAHAITPNLGFGGCLALEDAHVLLHALQQEKDWQKACARFAVLRKRRVAHMAKFARWLGEFSQIENHLAIQLRNKAFSLAPNFASQKVWRKLLTYNLLPHHKID